MGSRTSTFCRSLALGAALAALGLCASAADASKVLIDFGAGGTSTTTDAQSRAWNNVNEGNDLSGSPFTLNATTGLDSGYRLSISNPAGTTDAVGFNGSNPNGTTTPTGTAAARGYPSSATADSLYGNTGTFGSGIVQAVRLTLSNLNPAETYSLDFFASRTGVGDNRETEYQIIGGNGTTSVFLDAANNTGNITGLAGITPNGSNQITINIDRGPNNNNPTTFFYYLGVMEINSVPEPASLGVFALGGICLLRRRTAHRP